MRLSPHALARSCVILATAVLTVVPGGAATAAPSAATPSPRPAPFVGGLVNSPVRVVPKAGARASEVLPSSVDLRQYAPSVGDQGQVGSCVAWTIAYGIMGYYAKRSGGTGAPYAPLFLYLRNVAAGGAPTAGLYPNLVMANAQSAGVDTQADYWQGTTDWRTAPTATQIANATKYRLNGWKWLYNGANQGETAKTAIRQALAAGNPVGLAIPVFNDFMYLRSHTVYNTLQGTPVGYHMITAFGYDDAGVTIRNSWGTWWGNGGDAKLSWDFITKVSVGGYSATGITTPGVPEPAPAVAPAITSLSTMTAAAGTQVTIAGSNLSGATAVRFGDTPATFAPATSGGVTKLVATAPARAAGTVNVSVTTPGGTSAPTAASAFTYPLPVPVVASVVPNSAFINASTPVTVTGGNLGGATKVTADGTPLIFTKVDDATLKVVMPPHAAGDVTLTVTTPGGISTATTAGRFSYRPLPVPVVTSLAPTGGLTYTMTPVVVTGAALGGAVGVTVDGRTTSFTKLSDTSLKVDVPPHPAGPAVLRVITAAGVSAETAGARFTYVAPPMPAAKTVTPSAGSGNVTTTVLLNGSGFLSASRVTANNVALSFVVLNDQQLKVTLPPRPAGPVALVVTTPGGVSVPATYTVTAPTATARKLGTLPVLLGS